MGSLLDKLPKLEMDNTGAKTQLACFLSHAIADNMCSLTDIALLCKDGTHYPLYFIVLQKLLVNKDQAYVIEAVNTSRVELSSLMPGKFFTCFGRTTGF